MRVNLFLQRVMKERFYILFLLVKCFAAVSISAATLNINIGGIVRNYTLQAVIPGAPPVWQTAAGIVLDKDTLKGHLNSAAIRPHCLKELIRLIMVQHPVAVHNIAGNTGSGYVDAHVNDIPAVLADLKNHLLEQGHLGFYPMITRTHRNRDHKVNKDIARGIFNIIRETPTAITNHFYGTAVVVPGGVQNPIVAANADEFHLFPDARHKNIQVFFPAGGTFDETRLLTTPVPPPTIPRPITLTDVANLPVAGELNLMQIADRILKSIFSQDNLSGVTISNSGVNPHPNLKFTIDCVLNPDDFARRGIIDDIRWIGIERDKLKHTNALRIPVEVDGGIIRLPTVFPIQESFLRRLWNTIQTPVKYIGAMSLSVVGWEAIKNWKAIMSFLMKKKYF